MALGGAAAIAGIFAFPYLFVTAGPDVKRGDLTAIGSVLGLAFTRTESSKRDVEARHFGKKAEVYQRLFETLTSMLAVEKGWAPKKNENQLARTLFGQTTQMLVWAGPDVLKSWEAIEENDVNGGTQSILGGSITIWLQCVASWVTMIRPLANLAM